MIRYRPCLALLYLVSLPARRAFAQDDRAATKWAGAHIVRLAGDLRPFLALAGRARVIAVGEPDHGIHEFLAFRNRLVELLVTQGRITAIAAETGTTESALVDDYITDAADSDDVSRVATAVFSWSPGASYPENRELVEWLRSWNRRASAARRVHFYGLDLTGGRVGRFLDTHLAADAALDYVAGVDSASARAFRARIASWLPRFTSVGWDSLSAGEQNAATADIATLGSQFDRSRVEWQARTSLAAYERARHEVDVLAELDANFRAARAESNPQARRESAMARNLAWVLGREGARGRVFLYAADWHISKGPMITDRWGSSLGESLAAMLGGDYVAVAGTFAHADTSVVDADAPHPDSGSAAALLSRLGVRQALLPLRGAPEWFGTARPLRGGRNDSVVLRAAFDALLFFDTVTAASRR